MLTDPQHDDSLALSPDGEFVRDVISGSEAVEYGGAVMGLLQQAGWELGESDFDKGPSSVTLGRAGWHWKIIELPLPDPPIPEEQKPVGPTWLYHRAEFDGTLYIAYDPYRTKEGLSIVDGRPAIWYVAGFTAAETAGGFIERASEQSAYYDIAWAETIYVNGIMEVFQFLVTTEEGGFAADNRKLASTDGLWGNDYTSGGFYTLYSKPIMRDVIDPETGEVIGEAPEGGRLKLRLRTVYWSALFPAQAAPDGSGQLRIEMRVESEVDGSSYTHVLQLGPHEGYANKHQFVFWGGDLRGQVLVSMLKSHHSHTMAATPVLVLGSESLAMRIQQIPITEWTKSLYWRDGFAEGLQTTVQYAHPPLGSHTYSEANGYVSGAHPVMMVRGCQSQSLMSRKKFPLAQAPWVVLANDPLGGVSGIIGGKLWDMVVLSGSLVENDAVQDAVHSDAMVYQDHHWERLCTNGTGGPADAPDVYVSLWIRRYKTAEEEEEEE